MSQQHIAVIGAGIVGVSAALHLRRDGHKVTLIDERNPGEGTSKGNAAVLAIDSCAPVATPGVMWDVPRYLRDPLGPLAIRWSYLPKIAPWLLRFIAASKPERVEEISVALRSILLRATEVHRDLARAINETSMLRETGWLGVFESDQKFESYQWDLDLQKRRGVPFQVMRQEEIRQFEPSLQPIFRHAVYYPENSYVIDNFRLVREVARVFAENGGTILKQRVTGFDFGAPNRSNGGPSAVKTETGSIPIDGVVVAAGAWSKKLTAMLGHKVPLDTERGYHVTLPNAQKMPRMPLYSGDHSFAVTPLEVGLRFAGTVELGGLEAPPNYERAEILMKHGRRMFGDLNEEGRSNWMGFRPSMPDSLPVISQGRRYPNTWFAYGHGHVGLTLGPVTGKIIADLVAGRDSGLDLKPFAIDRI
jgi:D-amino-acid dehydrogenase